MSDATETPARTGDPLFGIVSGLYAGLLAAVPVVYVLTRLGVRGGGTLYVSVVLLLAAGTAVGWVALGGRQGFAVRLGASPVRWTPAVLGVTCAFGGLVSLTETGVVGGVAFFLGLIAMGIGSVMGVMARTRYAMDRLAGCEQVCEFRAGWPAAARQRLGILTAPLLVVGAAGLTTTYVGPDSWLLTAGQLLLPVGVTLFLRSEPREYAVTEAGLEQRVPVATQLFPWGRFTGYSRTDDALVLHRRRRLDIRLALADLDEPATVERAIADHLPAT